jgi:hypothetical protein
LYEKTPTFIGNSLLPLTHTFISKNTHFLNFPFSTLIK